MVGYQRGKVNWSISIDPSTVSNGTKTGTEWELSTESNTSKPNIALPAPVPVNFDTTMLPNNATVTQLTSIRNEMLGFDFDMAKTNH